MNRLAFLRRSLVLRLTLITVAVIGAASVLLLYALFQATSSSFLEVQRETQWLDPEADAAEAAGALAEVVSNAFASDGWGGIRRLAEGGEAPGPFLVTDAGLAVRASTEAPLLDARVRRLGDGEWEIEAHGPQGSIVLATTDARPLRSAPGSITTDTIGAPLLFPLPRPVDQAVGDRFAGHAWRAAAWWIIAIVGCAVLVVAAVMRRALTPIDQLTRAARDLQAGRRPRSVADGGSSEIAALVRAFDDAAAAIEGTEKLRRRLISDVAHEIRTPVTNIRAQLEAFEAGLLPPDEEFIAVLRAEARQLETLASDFQALAVTDAGQLRVDPQALPLAELVRGIVGPLVEQAGGRLDVEVPADLIVKVDEERMRQVFVNLVENAVRHGGSPVHLHLSASAAASAQGRQVILRFADHGPGVAPAHQPFIFERFFRADPARTRETGGSGLGLAIVRGILEAQGAEISYLEDPERGAVFELRLPRA